MNWRDVPMPPTVEELPRDKRGFPVPWISEWSSGDGVVGQLIRPEFGILSMPFADCTSVVGDGEPNLGALCTARQIIGMCDRLCDVCGTFIPPGPIFFIGASHLVESGIGFRECGLHYDCALYSAQVCPGITTKPTFMFEALAYTLRPEFMFAVDGELTKHTFGSFADPMIMSITNTRPAVLMSIDAVPLAAKSVPVQSWVRAETSVHN